MVKALLIWVPSTRSSSEMRMTPRSQAYSTSKSLAMMMKFCSTSALMTARMMAKVMVAVAMMMHDRLAMNALVR